MIDLNEVLSIHSNIISQTGGSDGVRDITLLESALARPFQSFDGHDFYPEVIEKGAALIESIVKNHPFMDGNKRTGYVLMRALLLYNGLDITASEDEKYDFVIAVAEGRLDFDGIRSWIEAHV
ncbi:MAG: type II toxin-antitoxin system death-on-curing family toxin [Saprospiraceae bacterium]|nr:type II toxin-antitoxin system death-on-curing family toxin [Saprospiraceae bacterium]